MAKSRHRLGRGSGRFGARSREDPLNPSDDIRKDSCYHGTGAWPTASYGPDATFERDYPLEQALPATILGYPTQRLSIVGDAAVQDPYLGVYPKIFTVCLGKTDADATVAIAVAQDLPLKNLMLVAVKVKGATGAQMERAFLDFEPGVLDPRPEDRTVSGKTYRIYPNELPVYTTADTFFTLFQFPSGDGPGPSFLSSPGPTAKPITKIDIFDDVVRQPALRLVPLPGRRCKVNLTGSGTAQCRSATFRIAR